VSQTKYSIAFFFDHNIAHMIEACIDSVQANALDAEVYVLANGCVDATEKIVNKLQQKYSNLHLVNITIADKSNAWNHYVQHVAHNEECHIFIDGDITVQPDSLSNLANTMAKNPTLNAVGGVPVVGRDKIGWTNRMMQYGRISGGLYALSSPFIQELKEQTLLLSIGFIGEDFLVSALAKKRMDHQGFYGTSLNLTIDSTAGFSFRQLSRKRIKDYILYFRRLVRYRIRDYQLVMIVNYCAINTTHKLPI
jgi:glycosyltransferase involved in cell wall biosynthesis